MHKAGARSDNIGTFQVARIFIPVTNQDIGFRVLEQFQFKAL